MEIIVLLGTVGISLFYQAAYWYSDNFVDKSQFSVEKYIIPTPTVVLTPIPQTKGGTAKQSITETDPLISCTVGKAGVHQLKKSLCAKAFGCEIEDNKWYVYTDSQQCRKDQQAYSQGQAPTFINAY